MAVTSVFRRISRKRVNVRGNESSIHCWRIIAANPDEAINCRYPLENATLGLAIELRSRAFTSREASLRSDRHSRKAISTIRSNIEYREYRSQRGTRDKIRALRIFLAPTTTTTRRVSLGLFPANGVVGVVPSTFPRNACLPPLRGKKRANDER